MKKSVMLITALSLIFLIIATVIIGFLCSQKLSCDHFYLDYSIGINIAHLSDLHYPNCIAEEKIFMAVQEEKPDIIVLTGDIFDGTANISDLNNLINFLAKLQNIANIYAVIGNHEIGSPLLPDYIDLCKKTGITLLQNSFKKIEKNGKSILIYGLKDSAIPDKNIPNNENVNLSILLAHRPEKIEYYTDFNIVFSGHAHGGQIRIFDKGLYAPDQGILPKYSSGLYNYINTKMIVSRGLGDGKNNFRICNSYNINFVSL